MRVAIYPGSFDPFTLGHLDIVTRAAALFDKVIIGIGDNPEKTALLPTVKRQQLIEQALEEGGLVGVAVQRFQGLLVDFAKAQQAKWVIRGIRDTHDTALESRLAMMNHALSQQLETVLLVAHPATQHICASLVREVAQLGGDISAFVPACVAAVLGR